MDSFLVVIESLLIDMVVFTIFLDGHSEFFLITGMVSVNNKMFGAMINVGKNPTFNNDTLTIEAHIHQFHEDIYEQNVRFYFLKMIRNEKKFDGFKELQNQLFQDIDSSIYVLQENEDLVDKTANLWLN